MQTLHSKEDLSVNFLFEGGQEARFVRRTNDYAIVYLSSHRGCNQACRFCHLTQTKQTDMTATTMAEFAEQSRVVLKHYIQEVRAGRQKPVKTLNFNWMARGEPLLNPTVTAHWSILANELWTQALCHGVGNIQFNVSTIMPEGVDLKDLSQSVNAPTMYYSLYSLNPDFRKRWLPKAMDPKKALEQLVAYQTRSPGPVVLHWAFIEGENDSEEDVEAIVELIAESDLYARFNLVRYNPFGPAQGKEPSEQILQARFNQLSRVMRAPGSRIVPRVGFDVAASCGMFIAQQGKQ